MQIPENPTIPDTAETSQNPQIPRNSTSPKIHPVNTPKHHKCSHIRQNMQTTQNPLNTERGNTQRIAQIPHKSQKHPANTPKHHNYPHIRQNNALIKIPRFPRPTRPHKLHKIPQFFDSNHINHKLHPANTPKLHL